jgi:putative hemolysin
MILGILGCVLLAFLFSGLETGLASVHRIRLHQRARQGSPEAAQLEALLRHPGHLLALITLINATARIVGLLLFLTWLETFLSAWAVILITLACLPLFVVLVDFLPKCIFRAVPYRRLLWFAGLFHWINRALSPLSAFSRQVFFFWKNTSPAPVPGLVSLNEIRQATNQAVEKGALQPLQKHFIHSILNAHSVAVKELAVPLHEAPHLLGTTKVEDVLSRSRSTGQTKWLVLDEQGGVLGQLRVFDLLLDATTHGSAQSYVRRIPELAGETNLLPALLKMRTTRANAALIAAPGDPPLIVTAETLVRRILLGPSQVPPPTA